jgi:hypothetical protein
MFEKKSHFQLCPTQSAPAKRRQAKEAETEESLQGYTYSFRHFSKHAGTGVSNFICFPVTGCTKQSI